MDSLDTSLMERVSKRRTKLASLDRSTLDNSLGLSQDTLAEIMAKTETAATKAERDMLEAKEATARVIGTARKVLALSGVEEEDEEPRRFVRRFEEATAQAFLETLASNVSISTEDETRSGEILTGITTIKSSLSKRTQVYLERRAELAKKLSELSTAEERKQAREEYNRQRREDYRKEHPGKELEFVAPPALFRESKAGKDGYKIITIRDNPDYYTNGAAGPLQNTELCIRVPAATNIVDFRTKVNLLGIERTIAGGGYKSYFRDRTTSETMGKGKKKIQVEESKQLMKAIAKKLPGKSAKKLFAVSAEQEAELRRPEPGVRFMTVSGTEVIEARKGAKAEAKAKYEAEMKKWKADAETWKALQRMRALQSMTAEELASEAYKERDERREIVLSELGAVRCGKTVANIELELEAEDRLDDMSKPFWWDKVGDKYEEAKYRFNQLIEYDRSSIKSRLREARQDQGDEILNPEEEQTHEQRLASMIRICSRVGGLYY